MNNHNITDICLVIIAILVIAFTVAVLYIFLTTGSEPTALVTCFFASMTGELGFCGWIYKTKQARQQREWTKEDLKEMRENEQDRQGR